MVLPGLHRCFMCAYGNQSGSGAPEIEKGFMFLQGLIRRRTGYDSTVAICLQAADHYEQMRESLRMQDGSYGLPEMSPFDFHEHIVHHTLHR